VRRVLDVGCGNGKLAQLVRDRVEHYVGMDHDLARCREATKRGAVVQCADIHQAWPYRDRSVEAVTCLDVLEHVLDPRHLLREAARVLTPGGVLVLITPNLRYYAWVWDLCCGRVPQTSFDPDGYEGGHLHNFTYAHVRTLLHEAGFPTVTEWDMCDWMPPWPWWHRVLQRAWWVRAWPVLLRGLLGLLGRRLQREWMSSSIIVRAQRAVA
jgi:SAM-dependent methyltransferase